jgi:hypothetical protein
MVARVVAKKTERDMRCCFCEREGARLVGGTPEGGSGGKSYCDVGWIGDLSCFTEHDTEVDHRELFREGDGAGEMRGERGRR